VQLKTALAVTQAEYQKQERDFIALSAAGKAVSNTYNELVTQNKDLATQIKGMPLVDLARQINATKKELDELTKTAKANNGLNDEQIEKQISLKTALKVTQAEYNKQERDLIALSEAGQGVANTYNELVAQNKALAIQIKDLPFNDTTGQLKTLKDQYAKNNQTLKDFDAEMGNHQRNVGDYKNQILEASKSLSIFGVNVGDTVGANVGNFVGVKVGDTVGANDGNTVGVRVGDAVGNNNNYVIKNVGTGVITIDTTSSQTIDGSLTAPIKVQYLSLTLISDGANWNII
jgi:hypothetical protein